MVEGRKALCSAGPNNAFIYSRCLRHRRRGEESARATLKKKEKSTELNRSQHVTRRGHTDEVTSAESHVIAGLDENRVFGIRDAVVRFHQEETHQQEEGRSEGAAGCRQRLSAVQSHEAEKRCSIFPLSGSSRTVRRILTACLLSFLALLGSVSIDLSSNFDLLHTTEAAYDELTSCRTIAILQLVSKLQKMRHLFTKNMGNETLEVVFPVFSSLCDEMVGHSNGHGLPCSIELVGFCQEITRSVQGFLNDSNDTNTSENGTAYSLAIRRLLDIWGTIEDTVVKVKQDFNWRDVLSARLLVTFIELNYQLMDLPHMAAHSDFQYKWTHVLSYLGFARVLTERLNDCWLENIDFKLNSSQQVKHSHIFNTSLWQISGGGTKLLSGSHTGVEALTNTQQCLFDRAVPALRLASRSVSSALSMRVCLLAIACLIYPVVMFSFKQMTEWIQDYAKTLKEKTEDLKRQRQLAEDLLHQMLPKSVAKQLRQHKHVEAESYEKVTIFFSDIVGFTSISASCTPLQVVEMLNNLYMCFDTRIDFYDVYKDDSVFEQSVVKLSNQVETIGDAYMVVSGLPERNGDRHADEIAKMSLDLVAAVRQVSIPHMPNQRLQLRAGIHTAQKIHASSETYLALMKDNAYELQLRGEIEVKGKGKMNTYWLVGNKNYSVQNDSLVCHWNPNMARKKKTVAGSVVSVGNSSVTVQSLSENANSPVSIPSAVMMTPKFKHISKLDDDGQRVCNIRQMRGLEGSFCHPLEDLLENKDDTRFGKRHNTEPHMHSASKDGPSENFKDVENFKLPLHSLSQETADDTGNFCFRIAD
ncbi:Atrial natriuretic peptide receptor 1 [Collichthys lucidus]|uniref:guanylate cyclase n=1 Tax=Collichthys lucidus TaxID=240159 RepID=A0A4U5UQA2_COLLU|nr:Atrial natriuretic peptide receptor 1 [Collichthys lucidus]